MGNNTGMVGGVTDKDTGTIFDTKGNEPVRDKTADSSKGTPVKRFFTKDGTPVEPSTVGNGATPAHLVSPSAGAERDDVIEAFEYVNDAGETLTHAGLEAQKDDAKTNVVDKPEPKALDQK